MKQIIEFIPVVAFAGVYLLAKYYLDLEKPLSYAAVAMTIGYAIQLLLSWLVLRVVEKMHIGIFLLLVVSVVLTVLFDDSAFLIWKFTIVYWLFTLAILGAYYAKGLNLTQRSLDALIGNIPEIKLNVPVKAWFRANKGVAIFFFAIGAINLYIGYNFEESTWVLFKVVGSLALTIFGLIALMAYLFKFKTED